MDIQKIKKIIIEIKNGRKLKTGEKKEILKYYRSVKKESKPEEVARITTEVIKIARLCNEEDKEELFSAYLTLSKDFMDIGFLKSIYESGLASESSETYIRLHGLDMMNKQKADAKAEEIIYDLLSKIFPNNDVNIPKSAKIAASRLNEIMPPEQTDDYTLEIASILKSIYNNTYSSSEPEPVTLIHKQ